MNTGAPMLVVPFALDDGSGNRCLRQLTLRLRHRGLKVRVLRAPDSTLTEDCDVLVVSFNNQRVDLLAKELEHLWTLAWNRWYTHARAAGNGRHRRRAVKEACHA